MEPQGMEFPFKTVLSLAPLIAFWKQILAQGDTVRTGIARAIDAGIEKAPALLEPIEDLSVLEGHRDVVEMLMSIVFPPAFWETDCSAAFVPFHFRPVYTTPAFKRLLMTERQNLEGQINLDKEQWAWGRILKAYLVILKRIYNTDLAFEYPLVITGRDPETALDRYFSITMDPKFLEVRAKGEPKPLPESARASLLANVNDLDAWMDLIPPDHFEFHGFGVFRAVDVTDQEVLSSLKRDLIEKASIFSLGGFERLQEKLKIFLRQPELQLGLAAFQGEEVLLLNPYHKMQSGCIFSDSEHHKKGDYVDTVYADAVEKGKTLIIDDLKAYPKRTALEDHMIQKGIRSVFVTPLYYQDRLLGTLDVKSPYPDAINGLNTIKLQEILPLFSMALNRGLEELNNRVQAIIKEKCTAIHPSVEWRFRRAALRFMEKEDERPTGLEPIVFRDVYPLYAMSDIRGSSEHRNAAIQADLIEHLKITGKIIRLANRHRPLPILDALGHRISKNIREIEKGLGSGDEVGRLEFIRQVIEPVFEHVQGFSPEVGKSIREYWEGLDPTLRTVYGRRKDFEDSVNLINETIASYLDKGEEEAQAYFPHYFEKMKTDGVDHTIYIGASMVEDGKFDMLYLRNLRLWQMMMMCGIVRRVEQLKKKMKIPLETTHLILAQDTPLYIRFRSDERRFDVDGAYDIRHEIIKKRIDKAMIKGRTERLTQPGKIAVVYSHRREAREYRDYIDYLQSSEYLEKGLEELELQDLQGVVGLRALRVSVNREASLTEPSVKPEALEGALRTNPRL